MQTQMGLAHFWAQGDFASHGIAILLALLSLASWSVIVGKLFSTWRAARSHEKALAAFWGSNSLPEALESLRQEDRSGVFAGLALAGEKLTLLHLVGLLLIVAVGSNYALFFDRDNRAAADDPHTLASLALANLTTVIGFGVLAFSEVPVLRAMGVTVAPGAVLALLLSAVLGGARSRPA